MARQFLVRKDKTDHRDHLAAPPSRRLPTSVDLSTNLGPVRDQGNAGSCTGQAGAGFLDWLYKTFTQYFPPYQHATGEFSALFLYAEERIKNGDFPRDGGSDSRTLMQVLNQVGACLDSDDPYSDSTIAKLPTQEMLLQANFFRIGAYHRVIFDDGLATAKSVLASGYCRVIGIPVYQSIDSDEVAETGMLPVPDPSDTPVGGHEMLVYGYDDSIHINGHIGAERVRNSWGADWGLKGDLWIPCDYYAAVGGDIACDSWIGHMGRPWK